MRLHRSLLTSEFRRDPVAGEWVLFAPSLSKKPHDFRSDTVRHRTPIHQCPFRRLFQSNEVIRTYDRGGKWAVAVVKNKYPAVIESTECPVSTNHGAGERMPGTGYQYLLVTRNHDRAFANLSVSDATLVFTAFRDTYLRFADDPCVAYVSMFQNWGPRAGASVYHPHYQMIALPLVPEHVERSIRRSAAHARVFGRCIHCALLARERASGDRVVARVPGAVAITPFAPRKPFEVRVFPTRHLPSFKEFTAQDLRAVANVLQIVLRRMRAVLHDPDYNFFMHTAPLVRRPGSRWYHWHLEVFPHLTTPGGFEFATHFEINSVVPEIAARLLRGASMKK
jgi:UDPglucose--hexose-1-phosphate uridylyltransferase